MWACSAVTYLGILVLRDGVTCAIGVWLTVQQLPVTGANGLKLSVLEELTVVGLADHGIDHESYKPQRANNRELLGIRQSEGAPPYRQTDKPAKYLRSVPSRSSSSSLYIFL